MNKFLFIILFAFLPSGLSTLFAQQSDGVSETAMEQQYADYINQALRFQVRADSLTRTANQKRREIAFTGDDSKREQLADAIISLERESIKFQNKADSLYSQARAIELRLTSGNQISGSTIKADREKRSMQDMVNPGFLEIGGQPVGSFLSQRDLLLARDLEKDYQKANQLMDEVSDINNEVEQLGYILDSNPRRRERRRITSRIDELSSKTFNMKLDAMQIYKEVNALRYRAATSFLENRRSQINDSLILKSGLEYEEYAREGFRQAKGLRETAVDLRSEKYLEGFILRAYTEELKAFKELEKALEIYDTPQVATAGSTASFPLGADGRLDPATALSRSRPTGSTTPVTGDGLSGHSDHPATLIDFGFSVLPQTPYSSVNPLPSAFTLPGGMVYSIQLGIYTSVMTPGTFGGLYPVMSEREPDNRSIRYFTGVFRSLPDAEKALMDVNRQGFSDAFIVAYNNGLKMPVSRARQIERAGRQDTVATMAANSPDPQSPDGNTGRPARQSPDAAAAIPARSASTSRSPDVAVTNPSGVVFKIQLGAFRQIVSSAVFRNWQNLAGSKNVDYHRNNDGLFVYSMGNFNTFEEADRMRINLRTQGISDAFIVPYQNDRRITMEQAKELLR